MDTLPVHCANPLHFSLRPFYGMEKNELSPLDTLTLEEGQHIFWSALLRFFRRDYDEERARISSHLARLYAPTLAHDPDDEPSFRKHFYNRSRIWNALRREFKQLLRRSRSYFITSVTDKARMQRRIRKAIPVSDFATKLTKKALGGSLTFTLGGDDLEAICNQEEDMEYGIRSSENIKDLAAFIEVCF